MSKITGYFAAEKYIGRRFLLLVSGGVVVLIPAALAFGKGLLSSRALGLVMVGYIGCVAITVLVILRNARARFQAPSGTSAETTSDATREKFRKRIRRLQIGVAFFAFILVYGLWETRGAPWPPKLVGVTMNLLFQTMMIQSIRRMQRQLKEDADRHR